MSRLRAGLAVVAAVVVQAAVLDHLRVAGVVPDVMLLLALVGGLTGGPERGAVLGFAGGIAIDLFLQTPLGLSALAYALAGYGVGVFGGGVVRPSGWTRAAIVAGGSIAGVVLFATAGTVLGRSALLVPRLALVALVVGLVNAALSPAAFLLIRWAAPGRRPVPG